MNELKAALLAQMRKAGPVTWARAPDGATGTYARARISFHPRGDAFLADLAVDVYSQVSAADAVDFAQGLHHALHNFPLPNGGLLQVQDIQDVPADMSDPLITRLTMSATGMWAHPSSTITGGVS